MHVCLHYVAVIFAEDSVLFNKEVVNGANISRSMGIIYLPGALLGGNLIIW